MCDGSNGGHKIGHLPGVLLFHHEYFLFGGVCLRNGRVACWHWYWGGGGEGSVLRRRDLDDDSNSGHIGHGWWFVFSPHECFLFVVFLSAQWTGGWLIIGYVRSRGEKI